MATKFLLIFDSFKGSISSSNIEKYFKKALPDSTAFPISDGGEGFLECIKKLLRSYQTINIPVHSLNSKIIDVEIVIDNKGNAYLESSQIVGLNLIGEENIFHRTSFGIGEVLLKLNNYNIRDLYVGLGGSGLSEMGLGLITALGAKLLQKGKVIDNPFLDDVMKADQITFDNFCYPGYNIHIVNDVDNPLIGINGANYVYAKQKGANEEDIKLLDICFEKLKKLLSDYLINSSDTKGDGSAGGLGFIFKHILKAQYHQGIEFILSLIDFDKIKNNYDYIITGEGKFDNQSFHEKVVGGILTHTDRDKVIIVCGINENEYRKNVYAIYPKYAKNIRDAIKHPKKYLKEIIIDIKRKTGVIAKAKHSFPLFIDKDSQILILGSFPSVKSRKENFYYMNPYNRFYKVISGVYNEPCPNDLKGKQKLLSTHHIALYDVIEECEIEGSKDSSIINPKIADIAKIINNSSINKIILNGGKAGELFKKHFPQYVDKAIFLPSTSPLNASMSLEKLITIYRNALL